MRNVLTKEINSDCGLDSDGCTLSFSSNLLLTNLSIMLVLPVLLSPKSTILKVRLPIVEDVIDMF